MNRLKILSLAWALCGLIQSHLLAGTGPDDVVDKGESDVTLTLTRFDVNDQGLNLTYKITNHSPHDVWVCDGVTVDLGPDLKDYDVYLERDMETLVIRKRLEVAERVNGTIELLRNYQGRYIRLRPGQDRSASLSMVVPVEQYSILMWIIYNADYAKRLTLEIGVYDGDLPGFIEKTIASAERLGCKPTADVIASEWVAFYQYFGGFRIADAFGGLAGFHASYKNGDDEITVMRTWPVVLGERPLQMTIDGVSIPYKGAR